MLRALSPAVCVAGSLVLVLAGCSSDDGADRSSDDRVPISARAIAAVAIDHFPEATSAEETESAGDLGTEATGAVLRFHGREMGRGNMLEIVVGRKLGPFYQPCPEGGRFTCRLGVSKRGNPYRLVWQRAVRRGGFVSVLLDRGDQELFVVWSGSKGHWITGDPRKLDLEVGVAEMIELLDDPRLGLTTTQETIDEGQDVGIWG